MSRAKTEYNTCNITGRCQDVVSAATTESSSTWEAPYKAMKASVKRSRKGPRVDGRTGRRCQAITGVLYDKRIPQRVNGHMYTMAVQPAMLYAANFGHQACQETFLKIFIRTVIEALVFRFHKTSPI